ncbi:hypothetical protein [Actinokineospora diospyrosa]|uniref:KAP-like P-loop domain-containing protein n=1 Tax=Actinokineospora diospyrosa TaxID=103728 RepID=A0ABT1IEL2_9PSEU|nr:hypothetical protein [Actinokineospora diospyrosa]MCP2271065.1 hypothetical protein [Actinokineospora diospyrosa]
MRVWLFAVTVTAVVIGGLLLLGGGLTMPVLMRGGTPALGVLLAVVAITAAAVLLRRLRTRATAADESPDITLEAARELVAESLRGRLPENAFLQHYVDHDNEVPRTKLLAEVLADPTYRLVVVSTSSRLEATSAADRIADALVRSRADTDPVPFPVSADGWVPDRSGLWTWLQGELTEAVPGLTNSMARRLVFENEVLPLLYDVPVEHHAALALALSHGSFRAVVTAGPAEYPTTVDQAETHALLLVPAPASTADWYIAKRTSEDPRWHEVRAALEFAPAGAVLRTPIGMDLAIDHYSTPGTLPAELLDTTRFPTSAAVLRHLLDETILAATPGQPDNPLVPDEFALRWVRWLAARGHRELTWWRLPEAISHWVFDVIAVVLAAIVGSVITFSTTGAGGAGRVLLAVVAAAAMGGAMATAARSWKPVTRPVDGHDGLSKAIELLGIVQLVCCGYLYVFDAEGSTAYLDYVIPATGVLVLALMWGASLFKPHVPVDSDAAEVMQRDGDYTFTRVMAATAASSSVVYVLWGEHVERWVWLVLFLTIAMAASAGTAVFRYSVAGFVLGLRSALPWNPVEFLDDLAERGLLRRRGARYWFRYPELRERAAAQHADSPLPARRTDTAVLDVIADQTKQLTAQAFERAGVRAVVDTAGVAALEEEVVALVTTYRDTIASSAAAPRARFTEAKRRYVEQVVHPTAVALSGLLSILVPIGLAVATVALLTPWLGVEYPFAQVGSWGLVLGTLALLGERLVGITRLGRRSTAVGRVFAALVHRSPVPRQVMSSLRGLRELPHYPRLSPVGWTAVAVLLASLVLLASSAVLALWPAMFTAMWRQTALIAGGVAVLAASGWWATWSQRARWFALRSDLPADWPAESTSQSSAQARRDAVLAYEEWQRALIDQGVLPLMKTRLAQLSEPSYDSTLPPASVANLGDLTERTQFVPTETSARLERMLASMSSGAIGISGARGVGKSTLLRMLGERRLTDPLALSVWVDAPTSYQSRDFLVHLFTRVCEEVIKSDRDKPRPRPGRRQVLWALAVVLLGGAVIAGAVLWPKPVDWVLFVGSNLRILVIAAGAVVALAPLVYLAVVRRRWVRAKRPLDVVERAREHLEGLRYLETKSTARTAAVKPPAWVEMSRANTRQRAAQAKTYPELVADFRLFLGDVGLRLRSGPDGADSRIVICVDELDKIATAVDAERFINDLKTVFGVHGCFFLVAVSEDALASFDRRALAVRTTFDSAFETVIRVDRFTLDFTRRLLVQRVLRLPEPYVWLCHALSGGLPRDLNRTVRQLYDLRSTANQDQLPHLATALVDLDLRTVVRGQLTRVSGRVDPGTGALVQWLSRALTVDRTPAALTTHANAVPLPDPANPHHDDLLHLAQQTSVYLHYTATLLRAFTDNLPRLITALRGSAAAPISDLADTRTHLSVDPALALEHLNASRAALPH